jgi:RP/EB family microtubule-associated protein
MLIPLVLFKRHLMDAAYFLGRRELLDFFNELLHLNLTKIEQTASGAVACQLADYIFPGSIPMQRVNWEAQTDYEFFQNYKLLRAAFNKHNVRRHIDVDRLVRAKYQDNLEFCQWLKAFFRSGGCPP